jgi:hypothetical protein
MMRLPDLDVCGPDNEDARNTHIFDARALAPSGRVGLYFTAGNGTDPVRVYQILD